MSTTEHPGQPRDFVDAITERKTRTITLTDARPVKIYEDEWPIIAEARTHSGEIECQANEEWSIRVREHADGRRIVYAYRDRGPGGMALSYRGIRAGRLIPTRRSKDGHDPSYHNLALGPDEVATIKAIGEMGDAIDDNALADECIADLPAEEI